MKHHTSHGNLRRMATSILVTTAILLCINAVGQPVFAAGGQKVPALKLPGNRFFTLSSFIRVNQIETSRDKNDGVDESGIHTPEAARKFRETIEKCWPGARITWSFSWLALKDQRLNYLDLKKQVVSYHEKLIDFTRYDIKAQEPNDPKPGQNTRNWSLMNRLNQKGIRPQDKPIDIGQLNADEQAIIRRRYPELF
jgi:hypothetical protein